MSKLFPFSGPPLKRNSCMQTESKQEVTKCQNIVEILLCIQILSEKKNTYFFYLFYFILFIYFLCGFYGSFKNISFISNRSFIKSGRKPENPGKKPPDHT